MSQESLSTVQNLSVPAPAYYTPIDQRSGEIGNAVENRTGEQIKADREYQAVMSKTDTYDEQFGTHDPEKNPPWEMSGQRMRQLEKVADDAKWQREYDALQTSEEKELHVYRRRVAAAERKAEQKELRREWIKGVSGELTRLAELRAEFTETDGWHGSDVAAVEKAMIQFRTLGSDLDIARKMLSEIESSYEAKLAQKELEIEAQILNHRNAIERLREKRKQQPDRVYHTTEDAAYIAARKEWEQARADGNEALAGQLRSKYFAEMMEREKAAKHATN